MWQDEVQRIGKQRCTPKGYLLHGISDLIGFIAMLLLLAVICYLAYARFSGIFTWPLLWMVAVPFVVAIVGNILHSYSWHFADRQEFEYDYEKRTATWRNSAGEIETFTYEDWRQSYTNKSGTAGT